MGGRLSNLTPPLPCVKEEGQGTGPKWTHAVEFDMVCWANVTPGLALSASSYKLNSLNFGFVITLPKHIFISAFVQRTISFSFSAFLTPSHEVSLLLSPCVVIL